MAKDGIGIRYYNTKKGEVIAIKLFKDSEFYITDYVAFEVVKDSLYFKKSDGKNGVRMSDNRVMQISKSAVVNVLKPFVGSYPLHHDAFTDKYYIRLSEKSEAIKSSTYGTGKTGNRTNHLHSDRINTRGRDTMNVDADVDIEAITKSIYCDVDMSGARLNTEESKPYASVTKKMKRISEANSVNNSVSNGTQSCLKVLINLALAQLESKEYNTTRGTLMTMREVLSSDS